MSNNIIKISAAVLCIIIFAALLPLIIVQSSYLSLGVAEKNIVSFEIVEYENEPFYSPTVSRTVYSDPNTVLLLQTNINNESAAYIEGNKSNKMIFIFYDDETILNGYIDEEKIGLDYGRVWIKVDWDNII